MQVEEAIHVSKTKNILGSFLGSISEWYEFVVYGFCAPFLAPLFFPSHSKFISILAVFGAFASGFLVRPLGALIFGYFGDRYSRKKTMAIAVILIGLPTLVMGLMPTYQTIGVIAPIILIVTRLLQGISVGGQFTGSAVFINEHIGKNYRYFGAGITFAGAFVGMLLASAVGEILTSLLSHVQLAAWGWRIPFLLGIFVTLLGYYLKSHTSEPASFKRLKTEHALSHNPIIGAFKNEKTNMVLSALVCWLTPLIVYQLFIFMPIYANKYLQLPLDETLQINTIAMIILSFCTLLFGFFADKMGYPIVMLTASIILMILGFPLYQLLAIKPNLLIFIQILFAVLGGAFIGPVMGVLSSIFALKTRYTALSFSYNVGFGIFGGTAALINILLIDKTGIIASPGIYLAFGAFVSTIALIVVIIKTKNVIIK